MRYQEPEFLPWDGRRVPMTFVAGYLGSGKTTLINAVLEQTDRPIAVLVNDVGEINIDARLLKRSSGDTIELTDGCVCCSLNEGFGVALDALRTREQPPDHVVVELSGVAEPHKVIPWSASAGFTLDGVITLVDVERFDELSAHSILGHAMQAQLDSADVVLLTKTDLAPERVASVRSEVEARSGGATVLSGVSDIGTSLLQLGGRRPGGAAAVPGQTLFDAHVVSVLRLPPSAHQEELFEILASLPDDVVRAKGIAEGIEGRRWLLQLVGRRHSVTLLPPPEMQEPTDLVVISLPVR